MTPHVLARILTVSGFTALIGITAVVHFGIPSGQSVSTELGTEATRPARIISPALSEEPPQPPATTAAVRLQGSASLTQPAERSAPPASSGTPAPMAAVEPSSSAQQAAAPALSTAPNSPLVDINSASIDELNGLGGQFGNAIIRGRPYGSIDELVSKRILKRAVFSQIKDRIAAH